MRKKKKKTTVQPLSTTLTGISMSQHPFMAGIVCTDLCDVPARARNVNEADGALFSHRREGGAHVDSNG